MVAVWIVLGVLVGLCGAYVLSVMGRRKHPEMEKFRGWKYAHRGLHSPGKPENSMAAFRAALEGGYGIELDVHLLKDGTLAVMHDSPLKRTTGCEGRVEELTAQQLGDYRLEGTDETIPAFEQVLQLFDGKAPMIVELKAVGNNYAELSAAVCDLLTKYPGMYCLESFDPRCIRWLKKNRPEWIRGQLTQNYFKGASPKIPGIVKFAATHQMLNFLTRPDFVAYRFADRKTLSNFLARKVWGLEGVTWTLRKPQELEEAVDEGWLPIFENFIPRKKEHP